MAFTHPVGIAFLSVFVIILAAATSVMLACVCIGCCSYKLKHARGLQPSAAQKHKDKMELYPSYKPESSFPADARSLSSHTPASSVLFTAPPPSYGDVV